MRADLRNKRFRFALGVLVIVVGDRRSRRRIIVDRYMYHPPRNDVYWLNKPVQGMTYFHGEDLRRVRPAHVD